MRRTSVTHLGEVLCVLAAVPLSGGAWLDPAHAQTERGSPRIDLQILVLSADDPGTQMVMAGLREVGVPFTEVALEAPHRVAVSEAFLTGGSAPERRAKFQAIVAPNESPAQLTLAERDALNRFQREFGIRRLDSYVFPSPAVMLRTPGANGYIGSLDGMQARAADGVGNPFGYLAGAVSFDDRSADVSESYGYLSTPLSDARAQAPSDGAASAPGITPLVEMAIPGSEERGVLIGVYRDAGREAMVVTCAMNVYQFQQQALFPGILSWLTYDVHLGRERHYLTVHIDDIFLGDARWIPAHDCTRGNDCPVGVSAPDIHMSIEDVAFLVDWQQRNLFALDMVYNGDGYDSMIEDHGRFAVGDALIARRDQFRWINHTYTHEYLGCVQDGSRADWCRHDAAGDTLWVLRRTLDDEIRKNAEFGRRHGLAIRPTELITGEHSGLRRTPQEPSDNPHLAEALTSNGILWIAADASREWGQRELMSAATVPRYPMNLFFNVSTRAELIDEFNWIHASRAAGGSGLCERNEHATCLVPLEPNGGFEDVVVPLETRAMLLHALANDPRPHYAHQSNLAEERLLYPIVERALAQYRSVFDADTPLVNPTFEEAGTELKGQSDWEADRRYVTAYVQAGVLTLTVSSAGSVRVPITLPIETQSGGVAVFANYAGRQSGWRLVRPLLGQAFKLPPAVGYAR